MPKDNIVAVVSDAPAAEKNESVEVLGRYSCRSGEVRELSYRREGYTKSDDPFPEEPSGDGAAEQKMLRSLNLVVLANKP
jgi:hypothetical protein